MAHGLSRTRPAGLTDARKHASGRTLGRELSLEEKYARLEAKMKWLEAENEFLKKLDQLERQMRKRNPTKHGAKIRTDSTDDAYIPFPAKGACSL